MWRTASGPYGPSVTQGPTSLARDRRPCSHGLHRGADGDALAQNRGDTPALEATQWAGDRPPAGRVDGDDVPEVDYLDTSRRPAWPQLPPAVRDAVGELTGSPVASAEPPPSSGFSGSFAAPLTLADSRRVFAKAGSQENAHALAALGREAAVLGGLPVAVPAPRLLGSAALMAAGRQWQVVVLEHLPGRMPLPWTERSLAAAHDACVVARELSPPPQQLCDMRLSDALSSNDDAISRAARLAGGEGTLTWGRPQWLPERLEQVAALVEQVPAAVEGGTGCHGDLRADNLLVDGDTAMLLDWDWLRLSTAWVDLVGLLAVARGDGVDADGWVARSPLTRHADPDAIDAYLAYVVSYMLSLAELPLWPGVLPAVRVHRRRYARLLADLLGSRRGWT